VAIKAKATDMTGRKREELTKQFAEDLSRRAEEMSIVTALEAERLETEVTDLTNPARPTTVIDEIEPVGVDLADESVVVRVAEDIEGMTIGVGNHYNFRAGQKYRLSKVVADHLREKGYLYDRL
jgi:hypothetical protein